MDNIVVLAHGHIVDTGSLDTLQVSNTYIQGLKIALPILSIIIDSNKMPFTFYISDIQTGNNELETELLDHKSLTDYIRQNGDFFVYAYYASASGCISLLISLGLIICWSFCREFPSQSWSPFVMNHSH